jgi:hypothetical protein
MTRWVNTLQLDTSNTHYIHGTRILLRGTRDLTEHVSEYFSLLYPGEVSPDAKPLKFEVRLAKELPQLPPDAVKVIQGPYACCYRCGERALFVSRSGISMICLDPLEGAIEGFLNKEFSEDSSKFFSLLGFTIIEILKYGGLYFLHGACVYGNGRAYLFTGRSGAGKTTAAFNLVRQGFQFVADDSLFLSERNGNIVVSPYYTNFHVDERLVTRCPEISGAKKPKKLKDLQRGFTRMRINMAELYPDSFVPSLTPERIIFPRISSFGESSFSPLNQMEVYTRLLQQTILAVDTAISRDQLKAIEKLTKQVKGFELLTGPDVYEDPTILPALLEQMP